MKKKSFNSLSTSLLASIFFISSVSWSMSQKITETKEIKKEFSVNSDATLTLYNLYGNINVHSWDQDKVEIIIKIQAEGRNRKRILERLEDVNITFSNTADEVSVKTDIIEKNYWTFSLDPFFIGLDNNQYSFGLGIIPEPSFQINYIVKMPNNNQAVIYNKYGDIFIDELKGSASIDCQSGNLNIGRLLHHDNKIELAYSSNSNIDYMKQGTIQVDYSNLDIVESEVIDLNANYSNVQINVVDELKFNCDYGKLGLGSVGNLEGDGDYVDITIGKIDFDAIISLDYGALKIRSIGLDARSISIDSDYTAIDLGIDPEWSFNFEVETSYTGFKSDFSLDYLKMIKDNSDDYYQGSYGTAIKKGSLHITSDYGKIKLKHN